MENWFQRYTLKPVLLHSSARPISSPRKRRASAKIVNEFFVVEKFCGILGMCNDRFQVLMGYVDQFSWWKIYFPKLFQPPGGRHSWLWISQSLFLCLPQEKRLRWWPPLGWKNLEESIFTMKIGQQTPSRPEISHYTCRGCRRTFQNFFCSLSWHWRAVFLGWRWAGPKNAAKQAQKYFSGLNPTPRIALTVSPSVRNKICRIIPTCMHQDQGPGS